MIDGVLSFKTDISFVWLQQDLGYTAWRNNYELYLKNGVMLMGCHQRRPDYTLAKVCTHNVYASIIGMTNPV